METTRALGVLLEGVDGLAVAFAVLRPLLAA
jgi:hypothetical protein